MKFINYLTELKIASSVDFNNIKLIEIKSFKELKTYLNQNENTYYIVEWDEEEHKEFYFTFENKIYLLTFNLEDNVYEITFSTEQQKWDEEVNHGNIKKFFSIIALITKSYFKSGDEFSFSGTKRPNEQSNTKRARNKMYTRILKNLRLNPEEKNNTITFKI